MSFRISSKDKIIEYPLPTIDKKNFKKMKDKLIIKIVNNHDK